MNQPARNQSARALERLITDLWRAYEDEKWQVRRDRIRQQIRRAEAELARLEEAEHVKAEGRQ